MAERFWLHEVVLHTDPHGGRSLQRHSRLWKSTERWRVVVREARQLYLDGSVEVRSADQSTSLHCQSVAQQLRNRSGSQHHRQEVLLLQVEHAAVQPVPAPLLQDDTARGPRPGVQVSHQAFSLPDDMLGGGAHSGGDNRDKTAVRQQQLIQTLSLSAHVTTALFPVAKYTYVCVYCPNSGETSYIARLPTKRGTWRAFDEHCIFTECVHGWQTMRNVDKNCHVYIFEDGSQTYLRTKSFLNSIQWRWKRKSNGDCWTEARSSSDGNSCKKETTKRQAASTGELNLEASSAHFLVTSHVSLPTDADVDASGWLTWSSCVFPHFKYTHKCNWSLLNIDNNLCNVWRLISTSFSPLVYFCQS